MTKENIKSKKGFTIIEVVLVLAIAGLIFLMVFVALPALQRSQRDTQRRDDMARFASQLTQYQSNNNNKIPSENANSTTEWNDFITSYLRVAGDEFKDPNGVEYKVEKVVKCTSGSCNVDHSGDDYKEGKIFVYTNATCDGEKAVFVSSGSRKAAFTYKLEGAGVYCNNN